MLPVLGRRGRGALGLFGLALVALAGFTLALGAADARVTGNEWTGTWDCGAYNYGTVVLTQSGSSLSGTYTGTPNYAGGEHDGRISGTVTYSKQFPLGDFTGTWADVGGPGPNTGTLKLRMHSLNEIGGLHSRWGNFICKRKSAPPATTGPTTTKPTTTKQSDSAPAVRAYPPGGVHEPGTVVRVQVSLKDDSGRATLIGVLLDGGRPDRNARGTNLTATGQKLSWNIALRDNLKGPLYVCVWAEDAAGNKSAKAPRSSCAYISLLVNIKRVSNTCGGEGWDVVVKAENAFGNTSKYVDDDSGATYTVNYADACNLHDAGYGGNTVEDTINGGEVDYHSWSRLKVDHKFRMDMAKLCRKQIPPSAKSALSKCIRNDWRYATVRTVGNHFFDADLMTPGVQASGQRDNG